MHTFGSPVLAFIALHSPFIKCTIARLHGMKTLRAVLFFNYTELLGWARGLEHLSRFIDHGWKHGHIHRNSTILSSHRIAAWPLGPALTFDWIVMSKKLLTYGYVATTDHHVAASCCKPVGTCLQLIISHAGSGCSQLPVHHHALLLRLPL